MNFLKNNKWSILFLVILTVIFFYRVFLFGNVLSGSDILVHWYNPWESISQEILPDKTRPMNPELSDPVFSHIPGAFFCVREIKKGRIPFWNPLRMCGAPQFSVPDFASFNPINSVYFIPGLSFLTAATVKPILLIFLLGFFTLLYAEKIGMKKEGALCAATIIMFSFRSIAWLEYATFIEARVWYPLILYVFEDFLINKRWKNLFYSIVLCSLVFLCHNPKPISYFTQFFLVYIFFRIIFLQGVNFKEKLSLLGSGICYFALSIVLAVGIASVQILPMLKAIDLSYRSVENFSLPFYKLVPNIMQSLEPQQWSFFLSYVSQPLIGFIIPKFFGWPADLKLWTPFLCSEFICYVGIFSLFMLVTAITCVKNYFVRFYFFVAVACVLLTLQLPILAHFYISLVPGSTAGMIRLFFIASFSMAVLSGFGLNYLLDCRDAGKTKLFSRVSGVFLLLCGASLVAGVLVVIYRKEFYDFIMATNFLGVRPFFDKISRTPSEVGKTIFSVGELAKYELRNFLVLAFTSFLVFAWMRLVLKRRINNFVLGILASVFVFADLAILGIDYNPAIPPKAAYPATETTEFLRADSELFRITRFGENNVLPSGAVGIFGIHDADSRAMSISLRESIDFYNLAEKGRSNAAIIFPMKNSATVDAQLTDLANIKYVVSSESIPGLEKDPTLRSFVYFDFLDNLDKAQVSTPPQDVTKATFANKHKNRAVIFANPPAKIIYETEIPKNAEFVTSIGIRENAWYQKTGDGVTFEVLILSDGKEDILYHKHINPRQNPDDRRWFDIRIDLDKFVGQTVKFILKTSPGPRNDCSYDWAGWNDPKIILKGVGFKKTEFMKRNPLVCAKEGVFIYENTDYLPRAFIVHKSRVTKDDAELKQFLTSDSFNPRELVLLSDGDEIDFGNASSSVEIEEYSGNNVNIKARLSQPGYLVLTDTFYPGWSVKVNSEPTTILKADYIFRAVFLGKGEHLVEFSYIPEGFRLGATISALAVLLTLLFGLFCFFRDRSNSKRKLVKTSGS